MDKVKQKIPGKSIIISHPGTDFDSLASLWAAHLLNPDEDVVLIAGQDSNVKEFLSIYGDKFPRTRLKEIDIASVSKVTIVDCSSRSQLSRIEVLFDRDDVLVEVWDHHRKEITDFHVDIHHYLDTGANSTILVQELSRRGKKISEIEATLFMLGIYEDTGSLRFSSTTPEDMEAAAWLLRSGASLDVVDRFFGIKLTPAQKRLMTQLSLNLQTIEIQGLTIHFAMARADEFVDEIAFLTKKIQETENADILFALVEMNGRVFIVGRSRVPSIDLGQVMAVFGGGGHSQAASCLMTDTTHSIALQRLLDAIREQMKPPIIARDIMSRPVKKISPDATIADAATLMSRFAISGLTVTDSENKVLGIITRREIDKALGHDLERSPVKGYMIRDPKVVSEDASMSEIQKVIIENHTGYIPVVFAGKLSGVITRSDIIRVLHQSKYGTGDEILSDFSRKAEEHGRELLMKLPAPHLALLGMACETADRLKVDCYLVGGIVRDLVIGKTNVDIDLLIEGDGIEFANEFASVLDGRVITNPRFRTAKVILSDGFSIDVATAREEFYRQPGALPEVSAAGIRDDLVRRDFTINTLAIQLNSRKWGELIDHFGGVKDIEDKLIRVLHTFSFVDDPTRILRALRFASRFDFHLEKQTDELLRRAIIEGRLDEISPDRLRDELLLCLNEENPWNTLKTVSEYGIFGLLHPPICIPITLSQDDDLVRQSILWLSQLHSEYDKIDNDIVYLAWILSETGREDALRFVENYHFEKKYVNVINALPMLDVVTEELLKDNLKPSDIAENLEKIPAELNPLMVIGSDENSPALQYLTRYFRELKSLKPQINGDDLLKMGYEPGELLGDVLAKIRRAKLNGELASRDDEINFAKVLLES